MEHRYVTRALTARGDATALWSAVSRELEQRGLVRTEDDERATNYIYPSLFFSSKRPLTCISRLRMTVSQHGRESRIELGYAFTKIRWYTIILMTTLCGVAPLVFGIIREGRVEIPPMAYLGIPLGFMLHYHVRWRVFSAMRRLVAGVEASLGSQSSGRR